MSKEPTPIAYTLKLSALDAKLARFTERVTAITEDDVQAMVDIPVSDWHEAGSPLEVVILVGKTPDEMLDLIYQKDDQDEDEDQVEGN